MKKILLSFTVLFMLVFISCNSDLNNGGGKEPSGNGNNQGGNINSLVGTWVGMFDQDADVLYISDQGQLIYVSFTLTQGSKPSAFIRMGTVSNDSEFLTISFSKFFTGEEANHSVLNIHEGSAEDKKRILWGDDLSQTGNEYSFDGHSYSMVESNGNSIITRTITIAERKNEIESSYCRQLFNDDGLYWEDIETDIYQYIINPESPNRYELRTISIKETWRSKYSYLDEKITMVDGSVYERYDTVADQYSSLFEISTEGVLMAKEGVTLPSTVFIPSSVNEIEVKEIGRNAFSNHSEIQFVVLPDSVVSVARFAFYKCTGLIGVMLSESVKNVGSHAFEDCSGLTDVIIPNPEIELPSYAIYCFDLNNVWYSGTMSQWDSMQREENWCLRRKACVIRCTDGNLVIESK